MKSDEECYESLRGHVLGLTQETGAVSWGLAVLIRHGVATWLESLAGLASTSQTANTQMAMYSAPTLEGWQREVVGLLTNMAMSNVMRRMA